MVYESQIVDVLHTSLVTNQAEAVNVDYPDTCNLNIAKIQIKLTTDKDGKRHGELIINSIDISNEYLSCWRTYAPGKFLIHDYRKDIRDKDGKTPYYVVHYTHGKKLKALLRRLIELDDGTTDEKTCQTLLNEYDDLNINGVHYAIIKICPEDIAYDWLTPENSKHDIRHSAYLESLNSTYNEYDDEIIESNDDNEPEEINDDDEIQMNTLL